MMRNAGMVGLFPPPKPKWLWLPAVDVDYYKPVVFLYRCKCEEKKTVKRVSPSSSLITPTFLILPWALSEI
jgi:hypothetical protein